MKSLEVKVILLPHDGGIKPIYSEEVSRLGTELKYKLKGLTMALEGKTSRQRRTGDVPTRECEIRLGAPWSTEPTLETETV